MKDNGQYARCAQAIGSRATLAGDLGEAMVPTLAAITMDEDVARSIVVAARTSMGMDISEIDLANVNLFTARLVSLTAYRVHLHEYLSAKMASAAATRRRLRAPPR